MGALKLLIKELLKKCKPRNTSGSLSQRNKTGNYYRKKKRKRMDHNDLREIGR